MQRLQKCLKGRALTLVRHRLLIPSSVPGVIEMLRMRYGNPETVIHNLIQKMRNDPPIRSDRLESLIDFAFDVNNVCGTLEASNLQDHLRNPTLLQELLNKLPNEYRIQWGYYKRTQPDASLKTFGIWLDDLAMVVCSVHPISNLGDSDHRTSRKEKPKVVCTHVSADTNPKPNYPKPSTSTCPGCNQAIHALEDCDVFKSLTRYRRWDIVKENNLCSWCLKKHSGRCTKTSACGIDSCPIKHHQLLHNSKPSTPKQNATAPKPIATTSNGNCTNTHYGRNDNILFRIVPVILHGQNKTTSTFAFLDDGSSVTLMEKSLAKDLGIDGTDESLCLKWTANTVRVEEDSQRLEVEISGRYKNAAKHKLTDVRTVTELGLPTQSLVADDLKRFNHLRGIVFDSYQTAVPQILIGLDNWKVGLPLEVREGSANEPIATKTRLGWEVHGQLNEAMHKKPRSHMNFHKCECSCDDYIHDQIKNYFSIDSFGVKVPVNTVESDEDKRAREILEKTTVRDERGYTSGLLWRYDSIQMPDNFQMAKRRLMCLEQKMAKDPTFAAKMIGEIEKYVKNGYARRATTDEIQHQGNRSWYLPIFTVNNPNKPKKFRIVWDAAAEVNGVSLNSALLKGPDQLTNLVGVLMRFRERKIAVCGDIREMFHQIRIRPEDQQMQRFLWRDGDVNREPAVYVMQVMTFGATCSPCTAQYVKNIHASKYEDKYPRAVTAIKMNHYVDDLLDCVDTETEAIELAKTIRKIHQEGGFEIRGWVSNSKEVLRALGEKPDLQNKSLDLDTKSDTEASKILGMWWRTTNDEFTYSLTFNKSNKQILDGTKHPTKREVLRTLMSIYDPLGLLANFLVYTKILLQDIWRSGIGWDETIKPNEQKRWQQWIHILPNVENISIPRCYFNDSSPGSIELHTFVDASENAFAAVCYFRKIGSYKIECSLVGAKTRVAPQKPLSIPRLELQAAILGVRLSNSIRQNHTIAIQRQVFWSDSRNVLCWIRSHQRKYRQFVAFRIGEILESSEVGDWRWVPTKENVADEATKWQKVPDLSTNCRWLNGPTFLLVDEQHWPIEKMQSDAECTEEIKTTCAHREIILKKSPLELNRFSRWMKLLRTQVYVNRFANNLIATINKTPKTTGSITQEEYVKAENSLWRTAQIELFKEEYLQLLDSAQVTFKESSIKTLCPYLDENAVMRVHGRIDSVSDVSINTKRPIILPKGHRVTRLLIDFYHRRYHHHNHSTVINELRQKFNISSIRSELKSVCKSCQKCMNDQAQPVPPLMSDLPKARLCTFTRPFTHVGVDYFGPMSVTIGRRTEKRWGCLFTCLTVRAVHIELANSLSTDSFIICLRNFICRRGTPRCMYSDNGTNFVGADNELRQEIAKINRNAVCDSFTTSEITWSFNPPASPHMGGSWERLIRSTKMTLKAMLPSRTPTEEVLRGFLIEVEAIINSRPLTYIPVSDHENLDVLTPNHFLLGSSSGSKPAGEFTMDAMSYRRNWKKIQFLSDVFWKRWVKEYLPDLTRRSKWFNRAKPIQVGDVVVIVDDANPRKLWPKGVVLSTIIGSNQQVRQATIQTATGIYKRPATKIAVLDVRR